MDILISPYYSIKRKKYKMNNKLTGTAGEYVACADAMFKGYSCSVSTEEAQYDLILDTGKDLLKVQVKSSSYSRSQNGDSLSFTICRRNSKLSTYNVDLFAFVDIRNRKVGWVLPNEVGKFRASFKKVIIPTLTIDLAIKGEQNVKQESNPSNT